MLDRTGGSGPLGQTLKEYLEAQAKRSQIQAAAAEVVGALAKACSQISAIIAAGELAGPLGAETGAANTDGDEQKELDLRANELIVEALAGTPTAYYASEEEDAILTLRPDGEVAVAVDPLDGSSNIDVNITIGTIFSLFPASGEGATPSFFRPGHEQVAAGYVVYGPHTALVITFGEGTNIFCLDPKDQVFKLVERGVTIPPATKEFAINASNHRHWFPPVAMFVNDCLAGAEGPRGRDFNMRWVGSLVAETHRIFSRGGVFLYPADSRKGYEKGRLRLIYEAAPIALLAEQAGGGAIDGLERILDKVPSSLHERTPLIFGSAEKITRLQGYHSDPGYGRTAWPLFGQRGLFRP